MIRVWLANDRVHCVLNVGFWEERGIAERECWGMLLADIAQHIAKAHKSEYGHDEQESIAKIRRAFDVELDHPTSDCLGEYLTARQDDE